MSKTLCAAKNQGFSIGIGLTYPLCGFIIARWGWRLVFYTTGSIGCAWCLMWYALAHDTPQEHPRITAAELKHIELHTAGAGVGAAPPTPPPPQQQNGNENQPQNATTTTPDTMTTPRQKRQQQTVPWLRIFGSLPVWSIGVTTFGRIWVSKTLLDSRRKNRELHILI